MRRRSQPQPVVGALLVVSIPIIGVLDQLTGTDYGFSLLYLAPIVALAWRHERWVAMVAAALAATLWLLAEFAGGAAPDEVMILPLGWNGLTRFVVYLGAAHLVAVQRDARELAEKAARDRDRFLSTAAHELRSPVNALAARVQVALRRLDRPEGAATIRQELETLVAASRDLQHVTRNLFDVRQLERLTLRVERFDLAALARDVVGALVATLPPGRDVHLQAPSELIIEGDPLRIEQVIANLIDNGLKFSPGGDDVDVLLAVAEGHVRLTVRDHGIGIAPEARERIFESFHQERPEEFTGMGIGLAVVRRIVMMHGGDVAVDSAAGGGSVFTVRLPLAAAPSASTIREAAARSNRPERR